MNFFILYCSNNSDIINESIENRSPLIFMKFGYKFLIIIKAKYSTDISILDSTF
jgi:hypothetical protein